MEAASRASVPAVPPRNTPPPIPNRLNVPERRRSPGSSPSRRNARDRRSLDITLLDASPYHERRRSDISGGSSGLSTGPGNSTGKGQAPLPVGVTPTGNGACACPVHAGNTCSIVCTSCVEMLCSECVIPRNNKHADCSLAYIGDSTEAVCAQMKSSLSRKMDTTKGCVQNLLGTLTRKKDRMIAKKDETVSEIDRFYQRLKAKLLSKLQREETELLSYLNTSVAIQASTLNENIQQCSKIVHDIQQKGAMVDNLDKLYSTSNNASAYLKSLLSTATDINKDSGKIGEITAARDSFLVIRFIINPETEQSLISTKVANVEVLNSRSNSPDVENIEVERINEAFNNTGAESSGSVESIITIDNTDGEADNQASAGEDVSSGTSANEEQPETQAVTTTTSDASSRPISAMSDTGRFDDATSSSSSSETDDEPPPPYPGLPEHIRSHEGTPRSGSPPPPYSGPSPAPLYVQLPEPQQPSQPQLPPYQEVADRTSPAGGRPRLNAHRQSPPARPLSPPSRPLSPPVRPLSPRPLSPASPAPSMTIPRPESPTERATPVNTRPRGPIKSFSVNEISDKRSSGIFSMAVFRNNTFLVIDRWNRKLKYFTDQGVSLGGVIFRQEPWDITKMTEELFAVTVPKLCTIYKVKADTDTVTTVGNLTTLKRYACIAYNSSLFICGQVPQFGEPCIDVIDQNGGPVLLTFRTDNMGQDLFSYPRYVKVTMDGTVVVCDWNQKCLIMFRLDGTVIGRYRGANDFLLKEPTGIELDRERGKVYVIDSKQSSSSGAVQKVSRVCQCEEVYRGQNDFRDARALAVYGHHRMAVGSKNGILSIFSTRARYEQNRRGNLV